MSNKTKIETALSKKDEVREKLGEEVDCMHIESVKDNVIKHFCPSDFNISGNDFCDQDDGSSENCENCWNEVVQEDEQKVSTEKEKYTPIKPKHYSSGEFDVIDFCHKNKVDFITGNIIKYVVRAGKKDKSKELEDLEKAQEYLRRRIEYLKGGK